MGRVLSDDDVRTYEERGVLHPVPAISRAEADHYRAELEALLEHAGPGANPHDLRQPQIHVPWAYELSTHPSVLDAVEDLIGPDILVCRGTVFWKEANCPVHVTFHQDGYCLDLSYDHAALFVTAWIALTPSNPSNGCVRVVPGTHERLLEHEEPFGGDSSDPYNAVSRNAQIEAEPSPELIEDVVLEPGQMSLHHANLLHGSGANGSSARRVGFVARYQATCVRQGPPLRHPVILARGVDRYRHYEHLAEPPSGSRDDWLAAIERYIDAHPEGAAYRKQSSAIRDRLHQPGAR